MAQRKPGPVARPPTQHLVSTQPKFTQCQRCGAVVLACYVRGEPTRLDIATINLLGEAMVLVAGGCTFTVPAIGKSYASRRNTGMIREGMPDHGRILAAHVCGFDWSGPEFHDGRDLFGPRIPDDQEPPF